MKNCSLIIVIISVCLSCGVVDLSGLPIPNTNPTNNTPSLSNDEVIKGLKEALTVGIQNSVNVTGVTDGFLKNGEIRLPFPPDALKVKEKALSLGMHSWQHQMGSLGRGARWPLGYPQTTGKRTALNWPKHPEPGFEPFAWAALAADFSPVLPQGSII